MLSSFLRTALRHLQRNRIYATLNILGLSVGLACFSIIGLWVEQQFSFDRMHEHADRIYQVNAKVFDGTGEFSQAITPAPLARALSDAMPEIDETLRIDVSDAVVKSPTQQFVEGGIIATDPSFFQFFNFRLIQGNAATALSEPYCVVVSEEIAKKYFGDRDPVNESLKIFQYDPDGKGAEYKITGIIEDCPDNSHFDYSMLVSFKTVEVAEPESVTEAGWLNNEYYTYVMLKELASASSLERKLPMLLKKYLNEAMGSKKIRYEYFLTPLADIHFQTDIKYAITPGTSIVYLTIFSAIGMIVLILACINYISLSNAYSIDQLSKVGIRKMLGASNHQVVYQHLIESWILAVIAMIAALVWIELSRPAFETIFGVKLTGLYTFSSLLMLFGLTTLTGILCGIYPSLILSSVSPVKITKGELGKGLTGTGTQKLLVVFQYSITIVLITGILVVRKQLNYLEDKDLGFKEENLLVLATNGSPEVVPEYEGFAHELASIPGISAVARSNTNIGKGLDRSPGIAESAEGKRVNVNVFTARVDHNYINTYRMSLIAGRNFIPANASDSSRGYIINEAAVRAYGYRDPEDAIGKFFSVAGRDGEVVGVVHDFHYATLREKIEPAALFLLNGYFSRITVRMDDRADQNRTVVAITHAWRKHFPESVVDFSFLNDRLQSSYTSEDRFSKTFFIFSLISITIACLGLFALVSYNVERRVKEIGIRKVLGATAAEISAMLSRDFVLLVVISCLIAMPIAWYIMAKWLENFEYHIQLGARIFVIAAVINILIAIGTVGAKTIRSALRNPVQSLRSE